MSSKPNTLKAGDALLWKSRSLLPSRKGDRCQVVATFGGGRRVAVQFWDGTRTVAPVECVRRATA